MFVVDVFVNLNSSRALIFFFLISPATCGPKLITPSRTESTQVVISLLTLNTMMLPMNTDFG